MKKNLRLLMLMMTALALTACGSSGCGGSTGDAASDDDAKPDPVVKAVVKEEPVKPAIAVQPLPPPDNDLTEVSVEKNGTAS